MCNIVKNPKPQYVINLMKFSPNYEFKKIIYLMCVTVFHWKYHIWCKTGVGRSLARPDCTCTIQYKVQNVLTKSVNHTTCKNKVVTRDYCIDDPLGCLSLHKFYIFRKILVDYPSGDETRVRVLFCATHTRRVHKTPRLLSCG